MISSTHIDELSLYIKGTQHICPKDILLAQIGGVLSPPVETNFHVFFTDPVPRLRSSILQVIWCELPEKGRMFPGRRLGGVVNRRHGTLHTRHGRGNSLVNLFQMGIKDLQ